MYLCCLMLIGLMLNGLFYCATVAYHVELNAYSGGLRHLANIQEKWTHNSGEMPWNRDDPSSDLAIHFLFSSWPRIWKTMLFIARKFSLLLDTETISVSLFYIIES